MKKLWVKKRFQVRAPGAGGAGRGQGGLGAPREGGSPRLGPGEGALEWRWPHPSPAEGDGPGTWGGGAPWPATGELRPLPVLKGRSPHHPPSPRPLEAPVTVSARSAHRLLCHLTHIQPWLQSPPGISWAPYSAAFGNSGEPESKAHGSALSSINFPKLCPVLYVLGPPSCLSKVLAFEGLYPLPAPTLPA